MPISLKEAYQQCSDLARSHYENFPVGRLVPPSVRPHVHAVYAFARVADDLADEGYIDPRKARAEETAEATQESRLQVFEAYQKELQNCLSGKAPGETYAWIFLPLMDTIERYSLPPQLFEDLLSAFHQDITKRRYQSITEVLDYCTRSANPVGRLVLFLHGYRDERLHELSDHICTGLQLANFWQDVSVDLVKDRIYLPQEDLERFKVTEEQLFVGKADPAFRQLMDYQVQRTWDLFNKGKELPSHLAPKLAWEIRLTWLGGTSILKKIQSQDFDTLSKRPKIGKWDVLRLLPLSLLPL